MISYLEPAIKNVTQKGFPEDALIETFKVRENIEYLAIGRDIEISEELRAKLFGAEEKLSTSAP